MARTAKTRQRSRNARRSPRPPFPSGEPLAVFDGLCRKTLATQGREVFASGDPLEAEMWVSHLLGMFLGPPAHR
jgi:hypothetical protein